MNGIPENAPPCPFCESNNLTTGSWCIDDDEVDAIECDDCKAGAPVAAWMLRAEKVAA